MMEVGSYKSHTELTSQKTPFFGGEVVSFTRRPPFTFMKIPVLISAKGRIDLWVSMQPQRLGQLKNATISSRIEPATYQLVAHCLKKLCYRVKNYYTKAEK
jgi:hypothetical protein